MNCEKHQKTICRSLLVRKLDLQNSIGPGVDDEIKRIDNAMAGCDCTAEMIVSARSSALKPLMDDIQKKTMGRKQLSQKELDELKRKYGFKVIS